MSKWGNKKEVTINGEHLVQNGVEPVYDGPKGDIVRPLSEGKPTYWLSARGCIVTVERDGTIKPTK